MGQRSQASAMDEFRAAIAAMSDEQVIELRDMLREQIIRNGTAAQVVVFNPVDMSVVDHFGEGAMRQLSEALGFRTRTDYWLQDAEDVVGPPPPPPPARLAPSMREQAQSGGGWWARRRREKAAERRLREMNKP